MRETLTVSRLPLPLSDRVTVGVLQGEYMKAKREGVISEGSTFVLKQGNKPRVEITASKKDIPSIIEMNAFARLMMLEGKGLVDFSDASIGPEQIVIKKRKK